MEESVSILNNEQKYNGFIQNFLPELNYNNFPTVQQMKQEQQRHPDKKNLIIYVGQSPNYLPQAFALSYDKAKRFSQKLGDKINNTNIHIIFKGVKDHDTDLCHITWIDLYSSYLSAQQTKQETKKSSKADLSNHKIQDNTPTLQSIYAQQANNNMSNSLFQQYQNIDTTLSSSQLSNLSTTSAASYSSITSSPTVSSAHNSETDSASSTNASVSESLAKRSAKSISAQVAKEHLNSFSSSNQTESKVSNLFATNSVHSSGLQKENSVKSAPVSQTSSQSTSSKSSSNSSLTTPQSSTDSSSISSTVTSSSTEVSKNSSSNSKNVGVAHISLPLHMNTRLDSTSSLSSSSSISMSESSTATSVLSSVDEVQQEKRHSIRTDQNEQKHIDQLVKKLSKQKLSSQQAKDVIKDKYNYNQAFKQFEELFIKQFTKDAQDNLNTKLNETFQQYNHLPDTEGIKHDARKK